jgi:hypothetical protein
VTFTTPAAPTATFDVTDPSITATFRAAILIFTRETSDGTDNDHAVMGVGVIADESSATNANQNSAQCTQISNASRTAPLDNQDHTGGDASSRCLVANQGIGITRDIIAGFVSGVTGGFRLNFLTTTVRCKCTAIIFAGLARASVLQDAESGQTHVAVGVASGGGNFKPDALIWLSSDGAINVDVTDACPNLGFAVNPTGGIQQAAAYANFDSVTEPTDSDGEVSTNSCALAFRAGVRTTRHATVSSFDATGITWGADSGTMNCAILALKFSGNVRLSAKTFAVAASTGLQAFNAFGFTPDLVLGQVTRIASADTQTDAIGAAGYFVTGRYGSRALTMHAEEGKTNVGAAAFNTHTRQEDVALLLYGDTGTVIQRATWGGASGSGGFSLDFSTASAGSFITALGIQIIPNPPLARLRRRTSRKPARARRTRAAFPFGKKAASTLRFYRAAVRMRWRQYVRTLWRRRKTQPLTVEQEIGAELEESSYGRVSSPGLLWGRIASGPQREVDEE